MLKSLSWEMVCDTPPPHTIPYSFKSKKGSWSLSCGACLCPLPQYCPQPPFDYAALLQSALPQPVNSKLAWPGMTLKRDRAEAPPSLIIEPQLFSVLDPPPGIQSNQLDPLGYKHPHIP